MHANAREYEEDGPVALPISEVIFIGLSIPATCMLIFKNNTRKLLTCVFFLRILHLFHVIL